MRLRGSIAFGELAGEVNVWSAFDGASASKLVRLSARRRTKDRDIS